MKNKILIVVRWPVGGIRTYIRYIYSFEWFKSCSIKLLTPKLGLAPYFNQVFDGADFQYIESNDSTRGILFSVFSHLKRRKADLIHSHGITAALLVAPLAKLFRVKHIVTTHDVFLDRHFQGINGKLKRWLIGQWLRMVDVINPCGYDTADNLHQVFPFLANKIKPIRNGIDVKAFSKPDIRDLRAELKLDNEVLLVGYFGRFMEQKGFDLLVDCLAKWMQESPTKKLHIACFGWGGYIREEQEKLRSRNLEQYFSFMPQTDNMPAALRGVDVAVMPSRWEACPLLPMEAMVAGTVVLASDCIGMSEVCTDTPAEVFKSEDTDALYAGLRNVQEQLQAKKQQAQEFSDQAVLRFDCMNTAKQLQALYQSVLSK